MSKYTTKEAWEHFFGDKQEVDDYSGRKMKKSACGNTNSEYQPTIDHIRPLSQGGDDTYGNIVVCHRDTNEEKADNFPHWKANNKSYKATRVRGTRNQYKVEEN